MLVGGSSDVSHGICAPCSNAEVSGHPRRRLERRRMPRTRVQWTGRLRVARGTDSQVHRVLVRDLAPEAAYVLTDVSFARGTVVCLEIQIPDGERILLAGAVVRASTAEEERGVAIAFVDGLPPRVVLLLDMVTSGD